MAETLGNRYRVTVIGSVTSTSGNCPNDFDFSPGTVLDLNITNFHDSSGCQCGQGPIAAPPAGWTWSEVSPAPAKDCLGNLYWNNFHAENGTCSGVTTVYITAQKVPTGPVTGTTNPPLANLTRTFEQGSDAGTCATGAKLSCSDDYSVEIDSM